MTRFGVVLRPELPPETIVDAARAADTAGVDEIWLWEDCFFSGGISMAATVLAVTPRVNVGIGVLPTPLRNVASTAMEVAALARLYPGRTRVGLGHGVQDWMGQVGARVQSPLTLLREQMTALTSLLAGETVDVRGRYVSLDNVRLDWPPAEPPPLLVGATGPKTLAVSGETSCGTILTSSTTPQQVRDAIGHIVGGPGHDIVVYVSDQVDDLDEYVEAGATTLVLEPGPQTIDLNGVFQRAVRLASGGPPR
jgi:alkanesulfonate monooxygenase SsuD/methylene tetrahydromethanopterin reductase-like flavin-dependent oxidoreductase (luciferase family)